MKVDFTKPGEVRRQVNATTARTIKNMPFDLAEQISLALSKAVNPFHQKRAENRAFMSVMQQEDSEQVHIPALMLRMVRSDCFRAIREAQLAAEKAGMHKMVSESMTIARAYAAGVLEGELRTHRKFQRAAAELAARQGWEGDPAEPTGLPEEAHPSSVP